MVAEAPGQVVVTGTGGSEPGVVPSKVSANTSTGGAGYSCTA